MHSIVLFEYSCTAVARHLDLASSTAVQLYVVQQSTCVQLDGNPLYRSTTAVDLVGSYSNTRQLYCRDLLANATSYTYMYRLSS